MDIDIRRYRQEAAEELHAILSYWMANTVDDVQGGFIGQIDESNTKYPNAPKGSVLNSRILWTFSAAHNFNHNPAYLPLANRAYEYIRDHFFDNSFGGVYWSLDAQGQPLERKKQLYAQAFALYALCEYYEASRNESAKERAIALYELMEQKSYDPVYGGYIDAFAENWQPMEDIRLSAKDANEKKTANTHLHILEAYSNLYRIWPNGRLRQQLKKLIQNFLQYFIDPQTHHLHLFFDERWSLKPGPVSFGHDIEAGWLLLEAATRINDPTMISATKEKAVLIANAAREGLDTDGGLWYEREGDHWVKEKHWWPQAEAMVGFLNAYEVSGEQAFLQHSWNCWQFVKKVIKDNALGEWYWGVDSNNVPMPFQDKAGLWKCPYHNSRACIEVARRLQVLGDQ